jgi:predicted RNase H-like HicB family nuclease
MEKKSLRFTSVFTADSKGRGYTGYFAEFPHVTAQGATKEETELNLISSLQDILKAAKEKENYINNISSKETHEVNLVFA